jgi:hypothetical protein
VTTTSTEELRNRRYKLRFNRLQKYIKQLVFVNNCLQSELNQCIEKVSKASDERRFLLNKILSYQKDVSQDMSNRILHSALSKKQNTKYSSISPLSSTQNTKHSPLSTLSSTKHSSLSPLSSTSTQTSFSSQLMTNSSNLLITSSSTSQTNTLVTNCVSHSTQSLSTINTNKKRKLSDSQLNTKNVKQSQSLSQINSNETSVTKKVIQPLPLISGRPLFPLTIGGLTVHSLGEVVFDRNAYHTQDFIFPVGFCSSRSYASMKNPKQRCVYKCKITDNGECPQFEIIADDDSIKPLVGKCSDECLRQLLSAVCPELLVTTIISPGRMGSAFFGYSNPNIQSLIQNNPNSKKCVNYKWIKFEVSKSSNNSEEMNELSNAILNFDALQAKIK